MSILKQCEWKATEYFCKVLDDGQFEYAIDGDGFLLIEEERYSQALKAMQRAHAAMFKESLPRRVEDKYKVGYYDSSGKRRYKVVSSKEEVHELIDDLMNFPGQVSIKLITTVNLSD